MPLTDDDAVDAVLSSRAAPKAAPVVDAQSPDDTAVDAVLNDRKSQAKQNVTAATRMSPDQAAGVHKLAREAGLSSWAVEGNEAWVLQQVTARKNFDLLDKNPILAKALANNPAFADTVFDDMANADKITKAWDRGGFPAASPVARGIADKQQQILNEGGTGRISATPGGGRTWREAGADTALDIAKSAVGFGEAIVGLADLPTGNMAGGALGELGYDPRRTRDILTALQSDPRQEADAKVQAADGFRSTLKALYDNPMSAAGTIAESSLLSLGGAAAVRMFATRFLAQAGVAAGTAEATALLTSPAMVTKLLAVSAGSEGLLTTGSIQEQGRQAKRAWGETVLPALAAGLGTAAISFATGKLPGFNDAEVAAATAGLARGPKMSLLDIGKGLAKSMFKEGVLEELPQSAQEQVWTNIALGRPWSEGVENAGALGMVAGMGQGGGMHLYSSAVSAIAGNYTAKQIRAAADAQRVSDLFATASESLALKRDPVAFKEFFQTIAPDTSVFIDPTKLSEVLAESKLDLAKVLPSAAEQIAAGEIAGPGIEVPIGELITGLTGTGAEAAIIQHIRTTPDAMTLAEAQTEDPTKTAAFFQQEAERVMAKQAGNEAFAAESKAVKADILAQLNQAASYRPKVNEDYATALGHAITVLADRTGVSPMQAWQQHHLNIHGAKGPQTNTLNIGLDIGATDRAQQVPIEDVVKAIEKFGVKVTKRSPVAATYQHEGKDVTENTLVVDTSRPLTDAEMLQLANDLGQEAIPQRTGQTGKLYGPKAAEWGDFNPEFFKEHDGRAMSEAFSQNKEQINSPEFKRWFGDSKVVVSTGAPLVVYHGTASEIDAFDPTYRPDRRSMVSKFHDFMAGKNLFPARGKFVERGLSDSLFGNTLAAAEKAYGDVLPPLDAVDMGALFFTSNRNLASEYAGTSAPTGGLKTAQTTGGNVMPVYLRIERPLIITHTANAERYGATMTLPSGEEIDLGGVSHMWSKLNRVALAFARKHNADGIIIKNVFDSPVPKFKHAMHEAAGVSLADVYVVFDPTQIKSAIGNRGTFDSNDPNILHQSQSQTQRDAAAVAGPVIGVHFSKEKRTTLLGSAFGTGAKGAERERLAVATDPRIKQRIAFYVDTGKGLHPEEGVGAVAHTATLENLYDANADALKIFKDAKGDMNAAESAVLDAGYAGYLTREFGQQGAVVMLGNQSIDVQHVGGLKDVKVPQPPAANIPAMKALALSIIQNRSLPAGQMSRDEWQKTLTKTNPTLAEQIDFSKLEAGKDYYKDDLAGLLWQGGHWYFSQLQAAVEKAPAKVFTSGNAVKQWLVSNAGKLGVKQAEIEATGVTDWLDTQGKTPVDRAMVVEFLKGNGVKITETMLDSNDVVIATEIKDGADLRGYHVTVDDAGSTWTVYDANTEEIVKTIRGERWAVADWINAATEGKGTTKFDDPKYRPPGGQNYRELLLTLPGIGTDKFKYAVMSEDGTRYEGGTFDDRSTAEKLNELLGGDREIRQLRQNGEGQFRSSHWAQPNVVAHMRVQDVVGADGTRNLEVIEIQSDWGQKGKKEGFRIGPDELTRLNAERDVLIFEYRAVQNRHRAAYFETGTPQFSPQNAAELLGITHKIQSIDAKIKENARPPAAPFVTDTKAWTALVIKRAIMLAAQEGYDGVVFATGEQNADFYKLSKQLDTVLWDGDEKTGALIARKDGDNVLVKKGIDSAKLADYIGKDVAEKLLTAKKNKHGMREVSGLAMDVGGEGMRTFYDEIVPSVTKTVLKQIGASEVKLGQIDIQQGDAFAEERGLETKPVFGPQPGFLLSKELRDKLLTTGVPLFARGNAGERLGSFRPATLDMQLLANANLTTFMHELGHFFLTVYADAASQPNAAKGVRADVDALLRWFGVPDLATWNSMTTEQQTPYHEKFAESFEQYLFSGKAPNVEMKTLYQRFASWMKKVYGSLKEFVASHPGAQLNPEVEAVMERMLATEQEIADANEQRNYEALFKIAVDAGMTDREFAEYMALTDEQREDAETLLRSRSLRDMKWLRNARDKVIAELQKDSRDQRAAMLAEVKAELAAAPIRRAMRWLKQGEMVDENGNEIAATEGNKLQLSDLDEVFPPGMLSRPDLSKLGVGKYGMVAKVGLHPDMVAEMFGFTSGDALVRELIAQPNFNDEVEALTDQRMLEEYGDLSSPEAIARAADEAVHNTARARMVATELAAVAENVGSVASLMKAAKEYARQLIAAKTSKTLKPWAFAAAEMRAGKAAMAALRKGDTAAVAKEKRTELVNHAAVKEAYAAEAEIKDIVARFKKIMGYSDKSSAVKTREFDLVQATRAIVAAVGIGERKGEVAEEYLALVKKYDQPSGLILEDLVKQTEKYGNDWQNIKLADLRDLAENVNNLWARAKDTRAFRIGEQRLDMNAVADEIAEVLLPWQPEEKLGAKHAVTESEKWWLTVSGWKSALARIEIWASKTDNVKKVGPLARYVVNPIKSAEVAFMTQRDAEMALLEERVKKIAPLLKPRLIDASKHIGWVFGKGPSHSGLAELIAALQHTGNPSNMRKLMLSDHDGTTWGSLRPDGTLDTTRWDAFIKEMWDTGVLTKEIYDFVQGTWNTFERLLPQMQKAHRDVFGKNVGEITAEKFSTPFGEYAGGYVPALTDRDVVHDRDVKDIDANILGMSQSLPAPNKGMMMKRSESYAAPLALDLTILPMQINQALLFAHMAQPVQQVQRLVNHTKITGLLDNAFPEARATMIMPWLARAASHSVSLKAPEFGNTGKVWKTLRSRTGMARMMGNLPNTIQQYTGWITAFGKLERPRHLIYASPALLGIGELRSQVREMSPYMVKRMDMETAALVDNTHEMLVNPSAMDTVKSWTGRHAYFLQQWADVHLSPIVWIAAYNSVKDAHPETTEQDARDYADNIVRTSQGATGPTDISTFEGGHPGAQIVTQFFGWANMQAQTIGAEFSMNFRREVGLPEKMARATSIVMTMILAQAMVAEAIVLAFRGGPDDEDGDGQLIDDWLHQVMIMGPVKFLAGMVPFGGKVLLVAINKANDKPYDDRLSVAPLVSSAENSAYVFTDTYKAVFEDGKPSKAIKDAAEIGSLLGLPTAPLARPVGYAADVMSGHVEPTGGIDFARGIMTGTASPESKR